MKWLKERCCDEFIFTDSYRLNRCNCCGNSFLYSLLVAISSKKKIKNQTEAQYKEKEQHLKESHEEALEKERVENKKAVTKQKEDFDATVNSKDREIDALKLFSKNQSEYVTDMRLIGIRERLVNEKRIRRRYAHHGEYLFTK